MSAAISVKDAKKLEDSFLGGLNEAQDAYEQIVKTQAWTVLGYDTFTDWWTDRVTPAMRALSMRPTREIAAAVVEQVRTEEAELPSVQRRTQRELAEMVGESPDAERKRQARSRQADMSAEDDLDSIADPLPDAAKEWIGNRIVQKRQPIEPADPDVREQAAREREEQSTREAYSKNLARCVWLLAQYGAEVDAADKHVKDWQASQDVFPKPTTTQRLRAAADYLYALAERWPQ